MFPRRICSLWCAVRAVGVVRMGWFKPPLWHVMRAIGVHIAWLFHLYSFPKTSSIHYLTGSFPSHPASENSKWSSKVLVVHDQQLHLHNADGEPVMDISGLLTYKCQPFTDERSPYNPLDMVATNNAACWRVERSIPLTAHCRGELFLFYL